jgi:hypothetical protein
VEHAQQELFIHTIMYFCMDVFQYVRNIDPISMLLSLSLARKLFGSAPTLVRITDTVDPDLSTVLSPRHVCSETKALGVGRRGRGGQGPIEPLLRSELKWLGGEMFARVAHRSTIVRSRV